MLNTRLLHFSINPSVPSGEDLNNCSIEQIETQIEANVESFLYQALSRIYMVNA